ncbi:MAG: hypothetical protein IPM12_09805 [Flavobacteriales bacterium]|nr:hypothetical protein [Flavobacteriales bacterium]
MKPLLVITLVGLLAVLVAGKREQGIALAASAPTDLREVSAPVSATRAVPTSTKLCDSTAQGIGTGFSGVGRFDYFPHPKPGPFELLQLVEEPPQALGYRPWQRTSISYGVYAEPMTNSKAVAESAIDRFVRWTDEQDPGFGQANAAEVLAPLDSAEAQRLLYRMALVVDGFSSDSLVQTDTIATAP